MLCCCLLIADVRTGLTAQAAPQCRVTFNTEKFLRLSVCLRFGCLCTGRNRSRGQSPREGGRQHQRLLQYFSRGACLISLRPHHEGSLCCNATPNRVVVAEPSPPPQRSGRGCRGVCGICGQGHTAPRSLEGMQDDSRAAWNKVAAIQGLKRIFGSYF